MIERLHTSLLFQPADIDSSEVGWEIVGVFNPAVTVLADELVMLARVAERPAETQDHMTPLPRWRKDRVVVDWVANSDLRPIDARVIAIRESGELRLTSISHFQVFRRSIAQDATWTRSASIFPKEDYEEYGIEDARVTQINDTFWITYVAVSRIGALTALMSSPDMVTFKRHGIVFPCENKDVVLFPQKINGEFVALHRPNPRSHFSPPSIWIARSPDLIHWGQHEPLLHGRKGWEGDRVGSGTPPILTDNGWLVLYHGSESSSVAGGVGQYAAGAVLLDRWDPSCVLARSNQPIMIPTADFETNGFVPNVVFPTAIFERGVKVEVFFGAADTCVAMAEFSLSDILDSMKRQKGGVR